MLHKIFAAMLICVVAQPVAAKDVHNFNGLPDFTGLVEQQGPTVVNISTKQIIRNSEEDRKSVV